MSALSYRVRQFLRARNAPPLTVEEKRRVRAILNDAAFELYQTMPLGDQRHALALLDGLTAQGCRARPLLEAALLHDVGKGIEPRNPIDAAIRTADAMELELTKKDEF